MTSNLPLTGINVVDFSRVLAGPHCGKTLLDLGADVVKFEPPGGDISRRAFPNDGGVSGYYAQQNAGKRNLSVDLTVPGATEVARRLCDKADVIVENFRPGALAAFGLDYESVVCAQPSCGLCVDQWLRSARSVAVQDGVRADGAGRNGINGHDCSAFRYGRLA